MWTWLKKLWKRTPRAVNTRVLIVIPTGDGVVEGEVYETMQSQDYTGGLKVLVSRTAPEARKLRVQNIVDARNAARQAALKSDADWFLWLDSDVILPRHAVRELMLQALHNGAIRYHLIGGWYQLNPRAWSAGRWVADHTIASIVTPERSVTRVDKIELGCVLMSRTVLEQIKFEFDPSACECQRFAIRAEELGYRLWMDGGVICRHLKFERTNFLPQRHRDTENEKTEARATNSRLSVAH
jgi:hypothetical protein